MYLLKRFLNPTLMVQSKECPNPLKEEPVLDLESDGEVHVLQRRGNLTDPIYQLFIPEDPDQAGVMRG